MAPVIEVSNLVKTYPDGTEAVKAINFEVEDGEFFGFLGPNGAGKSTTIKMLITLLRPTSGSMRLMGKDATVETDAVRRLIGYAAQDVGVDDDLSGRENLILQGELFHLERDLIRRRTDELLELMDLTADANRPSGSYSGGMRKRLDLATALMHRPRILFLDEPTTGLDPQNRANLWVYLDRLNKQEKLTIFLTTHYMEEADRLCHRLAIIDHGRLMTIGSPTDLKREIGGDVISLGLAPNGTGVAEQRQAVRHQLSDVDYVGGIDDTDEGVNIYAQNGGSVVPDLLLRLSDAGVQVSQLALSSPSLDDVFLKHTGNKIRDEAPKENWRNTRGPFAARRRRS
jgi:ABC-2 type transport system ATP-binding protein